jgi:hypothetical protein
MKANSSSIVAVTPPAMARVQRNTVALASARHLIAPVGVRNPVRIYGGASSTKPMPRTLDISSTSSGPSSFRRRRPMWTSTRVDRGVKW